MTPNEYQQLALRTEHTPNFIGDSAEALRLARMMHGALGACTEAGELQDIFKRHIIYGETLDLAHVMEEISDLFWYCAITLDAAGYTTEECMERNIAKLRARYPDKFTAEKALNRDLDAERRALEK